MISQNGLWILWNCSHALQSPYPFHSHLPVSGYTVSYDKGCRHNDIGSGTGFSGIDGCYAGCDLLPNCAAVVYNVPNGKCWYKTQCVNPYTYSNTHIALKGKCNYTNTKLQWSICAITTRRYHLLLTLNNFYPPHWWSPYLRATLHGGSLASCPQPSWGPDYLVETQTWWKGAQHKHNPCLLSEGEIYTHKQWTLFCLVL